MIVYSQFQSSKVILFWQLMGRGTTDAQLNSSIKCDIGTDNLSIASRLVKEFSTRQCAIWLESWCSIKKDALWIASGWNPPFTVDDFSSYHGYGNTQPRTTATMRAVCFNDCRWLTTRHVAALNRPVFWKAEKDWTAADSWNCFLFMTSGIVSS